MADTFHVTYSNAYFLIMISEWILNKISLKYIPGSPVDDKPMLVWVNGMLSTGNKPLPGISWIKADKDPWCLLSINL